MIESTILFQFDYKHIGRENIVRLLVQSGADVNAINTDNRSALYESGDSGKAIALIYYYNRINGKNIQ